jgi:hypothetical protein
MIKASLLRLQGYAGQAGIGFQMQKKENGMDKRRMNEDH